METEIDVQYYVEILNNDVGRAELFQEILDGLGKEQKELPAKLFYDEYGSQLFDQITELDAYYPTRTETAIMKNNIKEISRIIGDKAVLVEYGSGSSYKTRILLDQLSPEILGYVPIDISEDYLLKVSSDLQVAYPQLTIFPVVADYTKPFEIPIIGDDDARYVGYFPGSTIGNFYPGQAVEFLVNVRKTVKRGGGLLIGVDLKKDPEILNLAYNDPEGVTAAFNLNMLTHINRQYGTDFCIERFKHYAAFDKKVGRIEMHLISLQPQVVNLLGQEVFLSKNETIRTEVSYKYHINEFRQLASQAGFIVENVWVDDSNLFSVQYLHTT